MSFYPPGTILHEENNIRYQIYSEEYFESVYETVVESRLIEGSIYSDFQVSRNLIEEGSKQFINSSVIRIIAVDTSADCQKVVGSIFANDFTVFVDSQKSSSTSKNLQILKKINQKLIQPLNSVSFKEGDIVIGSGYGVRKEYQDYKIASSIMVKEGGFLVCQLQTENYKDIDPNISEYMKNNIQIVAYFDGNKEISSLQRLKHLNGPENPMQIV
ncbi:hypothetical protein ABPG72_017782 [Tetrahymena utriculariae]